jgi:NTE family protein
MLFHLGALWRLNEFGYLKKLARISSVSGGSITTGILGLKWSRLTFDGAGVATNFATEVVQPLRTLAGKTIDEGSIIGGILLPGSIADKITDAYRTHLFGTATLQDLPADLPRFVINATNVQTGVLFRFSRPYLADYRVGRVMTPTVELAVAVAASSAFPPVLSPLKLELEASGWAPASGLSSEDLHQEPYLTDRHPHRWRRLRQRGLGNGLQEVQDPARLQWRGQDAARSGSQRGLGTSRTADQ